MPYKNNPMSRETESVVQELKNETSACASF
jgi:hypothetical protein